jgi:L-threonylcarbamoyladenylate synthase
MQTEIISLSSDDSIQQALKSAAKLIEEGKIIAFPTDTLYGLGCNVFDEKAIKNLFNLKSRDLTKPINVLIGSNKQLSYVADKIPDNVEEIMNEFWPGDLTLIFHKKKKIPKILTGGLETIGVRMPNNDFTLDLICKIDTPLATTSANVSGKPSITNAHQILENFENRIPLILDGGDSEIGQESTIVSLVTDPPSVIRKGSLSINRLKLLLPNLVI